MSSREFNFDGLVGPTHNYAGLAFGNVASLSNTNTESNPKAAALQGLAKMALLSDLGLGQAIIPPQARPDLNFLKSLGFTGSTEKILKSSYKQTPKFFTASYSASSMWTANAATVSTSSDTKDNKLHLTPANLAVNIHRFLEAKTSYNILNKIFENKDYFTVHKYLPQSEVLGDEGAANYTRFCNNYNSKGISCFVYGQEYYNKSSVKPSKYPARQTLEASSAIVRQHGLDLNNVVFLQQNPEAIDQGVFHNDVCAVGNQDLLLCYEKAYIDQKNNLNKLKNSCNNLDIDLNILEISSHELSYQDMVQSYLFNSQLVTLDNNSYCLIAPKECENNKSANLIINNIIENTDNKINKVVFVDCRQSMRNGGGPACLRLRVVLNQQELMAIQNSCNVVFTQDLHQKLISWVNKYYRDRLSLEDLLDPKLVDESYNALDELTQIMKLGSIYDFQKN